MVDLNRPSQFGDVDSAHMLARIVELPQQIRDAWAQGSALDLPAGHKGAAHIVICGMGGSAIGGDLTRVLAEAESRVPIVVVRGYELPAFVSKDSLVIMSSNAYAAALAAFAAHDADRLVAAAQKTFALSLEGLNGNVAPFLPAVHEIRPYTSQGRAAAAILGHLDGSYLWDQSPQRALQDPLSFRTASHVFGVAQENVDALRELLTIQLNSSDDNPASIPGIRPPVGASDQVRSYFVTTGRVQGAVIPTANFEPLPWVVPLESLGIALSHVSRTSAARSTRLGTPEFTHLSRFLAPDDVTLAYSAVQKVYAALDAENQELNVPVSTNALPLAGDIEDTATSSTAAAVRVLHIVDNLYYITGLELMHAAQAVDLRRRDSPTIALGRGTRELLTSYREVVPFLDRDRALTPDVEASYRFLRQLAPDERP